MTKAIQNWFKITSKVSETSCVGLDFRLDPMHPKIVSYTKILTQPLSKCEKVVEMGKKLKFSQTQPTKPLYKSMKKKQYLGISLRKQEGFLIF